MDLIFRTCQIKTASSQGKLVMIASDESVDLDGEVIRQSGINYDRYRNYPALWVDHHPPAVGKTIKIIKKANGQTMAEAQLDLQSPEGRSALRKIQDGFLRGVSVAVKPLKSKTINGVRHITESILAEISLVSAPANNNTRILVVKNHELTDLQNQVDQIQRRIDEISQTQKLISGQH